jgi:hypothetical protein
MLAAMHRSAQRSTMAAILSLSTWRATARSHDERLL